MTDLPVNDYLKSCEPVGGSCGSSREAALLRYDCPVHGDLAALLATADDPQVAEKTTASANAHQGAAVAWGNITSDAADFFEGLAQKLRGKK